MIRMLTVIGLLVLMGLTGCASTGNVPQAGTNFTLDGCAPLLNCVSSESDTGMYHVDPIALREPLTPDTWDRIVDVALTLPGATLKESRYGYARITCYSEVFNFPDYLEILVTDDGRHLAVRSQSQFGLYDLGVNRSRVEKLRKALIDQKLATITSTES